jgi:hypothetical protein
MWAVKHPVINVTEWKVFGNFTGWTEEDHENAQSG